MCNICGSELVGEINKKRNWRPDRVISWARRRGLNIDQGQLSEHFQSHLPPEQISKKKKSAGKLKSAAKPGSLLLENSSDTALLDEVVRQVYENLSEGKFDLKLEHGFKAIEIKQKVAEKTDVENLLLELLSEIRQQELA